MKKRPAYPKDIDKIRTLLLTAYSDTGEFFNYDEDVIRDTILNVTRNPDCFIEVLETPEEKGAELVGVIAGIASPSWRFKGLMISDIFFYVKPEYRGHGIKLLMAFRKWADNWGQKKEITIGVTTQANLGKKSEKLFNNCKLAFGGS